MKYFLSLGGIKNVTQSNKHILFHGNPLLAPPFKSVPHSRLQNDKAAHTATFSGGPWAQQCGTKMQQVFLSSLYTFPIIFLRMQSRPLQLTGQKATHHTHDKHHPHNTQANRPSHPWNPSLAVKSTSWPDTHAIARCQESDPCASGSAAAVQLKSFHSTGPR